jgi:hypothetical protein
MHGRKHAGHLSCEMLKQVQHDNSEKQKRDGFTIALLFNIKT